MKNFCAAMMGGHVADPLLSISLKTKNSSERIRHPGAVALFLDNALSIRTDGAIMYGRNPQ
jgi:hypothetical protein